MTSRELFELASKTFSLMTPQEQVFVLVIFRKGMDDGKGVIDSWTDANLKIAKSIMKLENQNDNR